MYGMPPTSSTPQQHGGPSFIPNSFPRGGANIPNTIPTPQVHGSNSGSPSSIPIDYSGPFSESKAEQP